MRDFLNDVKYLLVDNQGIYYEVCKYDFIKRITEIRQKNNTYVNTECSAVYGEFCIHFFEVPECYDIRLFGTIKIKDVID